MVRVLLTVWYTATALLGPAMCCCSVRSAVDSYHAVAHHAEAPTPKRSCCGSEPVDASQAPDRPQKDPADCPCKQKKVDQLPPHLGSAGGSELVGHLRDLGPSSFGLPFITPLDALPVRAADAHLERAVAGSKPSGRDLLVAYQLLRC
jgi:hypothetical protein